MKLQTTGMVRQGLRGFWVLLLGGGIGLAIIASSHNLRAQSRATEANLTVHEWGTFTSIAGAEGKAVEWEPLNGIWPAEKPKPATDAKAVKLSSTTTTELPSFIEHFGYAGFKGGLRGTIRMETPVIYFYSPRDLTLSVHVAFAKGLITEWYPHASHVSGVAGFSSASLYNKHGDGTISWDSVHLEPGRSADFPREPGEHDYYAARETSAALVRVDTPAGDQYEKFLFYRGVSAASLPISARLTGDSKLIVRNLGNQEIPNLILFERRGEKIGYRVSSRLQNEAALDQPELNASIGSVHRELEEMLVQQGLFPDEAHAMVQTWRNSWFEEGSRLFYILPATYVDNMLPLTMNPAPAKVVRVFVGRLEIVTPATVKAVETALAAHDNVMLARYARFLSSILRIIEEKNPAKAKQLTELLNTPCDHAGQ